jgi:salicylate hydroxylase
VVRFGKTFHRYEETDDGRVRAFFADGTSANADLLDAVA